jgi:hypothetical protein
MLMGYVEVGKGFCKLAVKNGLLEPWEGWILVWASVNKVQV